MLQIIEHDNFREVVATEGRVRRVGSDADTASRRSTMLPSDTLESFEEVTGIPPYTRAEYEAKASELIRQRYGADEEAAIQRKAIALLLNPATAGEDTGTGEPPALAEFREYSLFAEECKRRARETLAARGRAGDE